MSVPLSEMESGPRFRHGLVIGKFYPLHAGHSNLIDAAVRMCETVTVEALGATVESIPIDIRADWVRELHPTARVVAAIDDAAVDFASAAAWDAHMPVVRRLLHRPVDAVFTSDPYGEELARRLSAEWVQVDPGRQRNPVSGTAVRANPAAHWSSLPSPVRAWLAARVVVLGAESTGTTTLAAALAEALGTHWVPEYGRDYSEFRDGGLATPWRSDEFELIIERQFSLERDALRRVPLPVLICDTDVLATTIWHERYVGSPPPRLWELAANHRPALYILSGDEIPFVQDGLRDGENLRHRMHDRFRRTLAEQPVPWLEVRGPVAERVAQAKPVIASALAAHLAFAPPLEQTRDT